MPLHRRVRPATAIGIGCLLALALAFALACAAWPPPPVRRAAHWAAYRLAGTLPPPLVQGRNGRLFLGNHEGSPAGSLIQAVCGGVPAGSLARAAQALRPILDAGAALTRPFRLLIVPTPPRLYPEDLPPGIPCTGPAADRLAAMLDSAAIDYPVAAMQALKPRFDVLPRHHFHWAGEGPLRVAEHDAEGMGLHRALALPLKADNRASDLNQFYPGLGLHDRILTPDLKAAGVSVCGGARCNPALPAAIVAYSRAGPGRLLVIADSFGDEIGQDYTEFAGTVWLVRMNVVLAAPPGAVAAAIGGFGADAVVVVYHDAGALALDAASQASLAEAAQLVADAGLPAPRAAP